MPEVIDYAEPHKRKQAGAIVALLASLCSGPAAFGVALAAALQGWLTLALLLLVIVLGAAYTFACHAMRELPPGFGRSRVVAIIAVAIPVLWGVTLFALAAYVLFHPMLIAI